MVTYDDRLDWVRDMAFALQISSIPNNEEDQHDNLARLTVIEDLLERMAGVCGIETWVGDPNNSGRGNRPMARAK